MDRGCDRFEGARNCFFQHQTADNSFNASDPSMFSRALGPRQEDGVKLNCSDHSVRTWIVVGLMPGASVAEMVRVMLPAAEPIDGRRIATARPWYVTREPLWKELRIRA